MNTALKSFLRARLPRSIRPQRILAGLLRGKWIVTSWHDYPAAILGRTERPLLDWFSTNVKPGETWLDIGAHYGYTAIALCRLVGSVGRVFAFEPMLSTAGYLAQTRTLNQFSQLAIVPFGLADPDTLEMQCLPAVRGMVDSTLASEAAWHETILVARLDWLWTKISTGDTRLHGVKIDVQGMETKVLLGMLETLRHHRPKLAVEVHREVNRRELLEVLEAAGYQRRAVPIEPVDGEVEPRFIDNHSYAFQAIPA